MQCPKCQFENPKDSNFCFECGQKLEILCTQCNESLPIGVKFCNKCGHNLSKPPETIPKDLSFDEKLEKIQKYLPKGLTDKILSQKDKIEGERKQVTVMFCDMEGSTRLIEKLGPEKAYTIMDQVYEILIHKVHDYEGTVNEMTGDGVVALFGAPVALENAPQRAIQSALAIHREITKFNDAKKLEGLMPPVRMRIGIHTGPVVVGTLGNDLRVEFKAVGETVILASRMESLAVPGATYVTEDTFKLAEGFFRFESLSEKQVKGKERPITVYQVLATSTRSTRFEVNAEQGLSAFVGRQRELELLLDGYERIKNGRGQAFSIIADAGVGKTRLVYEFRKALANEDVEIREGRCLSYSQNEAYHPIVDLLKSHFNIADDDDDPEIREKIRKILKMIDSDHVSLMPYFSELLKIKDTGMDLTLSIEEKKRRFISALKQITLKESEIRPTVLIIEDLHWIDKTSDEVIKEIFESIAGSKVMLIFTFRPEYVHTWGIKTFHSQINLNRLSNRESLILIKNLLDNHEVDPILLDLVLEKTEGVPFFIEELIKSLLKLNVIETKNNQYQLARDIQKVSIPSTIQDVIMARVDSLPEHAKEVVQVGSAIEREFNHQVIKEIMDIPEPELMSCLSILKDIELVYERGIYPQSSYIFRHSLTREVVYESILNQKRRELHNRIGEAIIKIYDDSIEKYFGLLSDHFFDAENYEKGFEYSRLAADNAQKRSFYPEAIFYGERAVICAEKIPKTEEVQNKIITTRIKLAQYYMNLNRHFNAYKTVEPIQDLATKVKHQDNLSVIYNAVGSHYIYSEKDISLIKKYFNEAIKLAKEEDNRNSLWRANLFLGDAFYYLCDFENALNHFNQSLVLSTERKNQSGIIIMKSFITKTHALSGKLDLAYKIGREALEIAHDNEDITSFLTVYCQLGLTCFYKGLFRDAENYLLKSYDFSTNIGFYAFSVWSSSFLGELYLCQSLSEKAEKYLNDAVLLCKSHQTVPSLAIANRISLNQSMALFRNQVVNMQETYELFKKIEMPILIGKSTRAIAAILLYSENGKLTETIRWIDKAIESDSRNGLKWELGQDYALYAELYRKKGDNTRAKTNMSMALEIMKKCGADGWVEIYKKGMAQL